jgi:hypothetical protein
MRKKKLYAIDFDGTLCRCAWPEIGKPRFVMLWWVRQMQGKHDWILWTCREGDSLVLAVMWCQRHGLYPVCANKNPASQIKLFGNDSRKVGADRYVDDKAQGWIRLLP